MLFCIVHFNTPEITTCAISSILKQHTDARILIFDNSNKKPFNNVNLFENLIYFDNTQGQLINFEQELKKFPNRNIKEQVSSGCNFGSAKHSMSIQWLIDNLNEEFILCDSDILFKKSINFVNNTMACVSDIIHVQGSNVNRIAPFVAYINTPLLKALKIRFFDGKRMHGLNGFGRSFYYDTGASFYEDITQNPKLKLHKKINYNDYIVHLGSGSWNNSCYSFLLKHKQLWE